MDTLQSWDALLEIEKKKMLWRLQERVSLQRELIAKRAAICKKKRASSARQRNEVCVELLVNIPKTRLIVIDNSVTTSFSGNTF